MRLERRRVLSADFGLVGGALTLNNFSPQETLTLSRAGDSYEFVLSQGDWYEDGVAQGSSLLDSVAASSSNPGGMLALNASDVQSITINANNLSLVLGDIDFGFDTLDFNGISSVHQGLGSSVSAGMLDISSPGDLHFTSLELTGELRASAAGDITDSSTMTIIGDADFTAVGSITLNENACDVLHVTGKTTFSAGGSILVGPAGSFKTGSLNFNAPGGVSIQEDGDGLSPTTVLTGTNTAGMLNLSVEGALVNEPGTSLDVATDASITTTDFNPTADFDLSGLVDNGDYAIWRANYGGPPGSAGDANGDNAVDAADYTLWRDQVGAMGQQGEIMLADHGEDSLTVTGKASFASTGDITIGPDGLFTAGLLNFNAPGVVTIQEDIGASDPTPGAAIAMDNTAGTLVLSSVGDITDAPTPDPAMPTMLLPTKITVTGDATFSTGGSITLADTAPNVPAGKPGDELAVAGKASFQSAGAITIGPAGLFNAGLLNFNAPGAVTIQEDSSTAIAMTNTAGTLSLTSTSDITDVPTPDPAMPAMMLATTITVTGDATFTSGGSITLADRAPDVPADKPGDELAVAGKASFAANPLVPTASITIGPAGLFTAGLLNFNAPGAVTIQEDIGLSDLAPGTTIAMTNTAGTLVLSSDGNITDMPTPDPAMPAMMLATKITVTGDATFTSGGSITLADTAPDVPAGKPGDELAVAGKASFLSASAITIGPAGIFNAGLLNFNAPGAVTIQEDSITAIAMTNTAGTLSLTSTNDITDVPTPDPAMPAMMLATTITVTGDATFTSGSSITLADRAPDVPDDKPGDELAVAGKASFLSAGAITIGSDGLLPAGNFTGGKFTAGLLNFNAPG
ncbi:MAG: hypothetical protein KDA37_09945, partial [Planctomycetales bacterium]|nr:hypothetical protein [Planctomycetales bacterium]